MAERARSVTQIKSCIRSQSNRDNRDKVTRTASELHRQTVDHAQRRFEQQLADSERELRWAVTQRRDHSSSPAEKRQATHHLQQLRASLNNDYSQLIQAYVHEHKEKVDEVGRDLNQRYDHERKVQEALQETQRQNYRTHQESINQIIRERDAICEEKLAAQKSLYHRLLDEQAQRLTHQPNTSPIPVEQLDIAELKGRLARIEYEHRELKKLVFNLRSDLTALITQQPSYRSIVNIPNFIVQP